MCRLYLEYRELCEQTRTMVCSICIPINLHRERSLIKLGKPFLLKGNFIFIILNLHTIGVAFVMHIPHVRNMFKKNIHNKVALT